MTLADELKQYVKKTIDEQWVRRDGVTVPEADDLALKNDAVNLDGVVLYADLADSTGLVKNYKDWFAAAIYKNYLYCAAKVIRSLGGAITAYDGDRVMAVFLGDTKNSNAAKAALQIHWAVDNLIKPAVQQKYPTNKFVLRQKVGVDCSKLMVARTGIRGSNDLVWVGNAANSAAKLAALSLDYSSYISEAVYVRLTDSSKDGGNPKKSMWTDLGVSGLGFRVYGSNWSWEL